MAYASAIWGMVTEASAIQPMIATAAMAAVSVSAMMRHMALASGWVSCGQCRLWRWPVFCRYGVPCRGEIARLGMGRNRVRLASRLRWGGNDGKGLYIGNRTLGPARVVKGAPAGRRGGKLAWQPERACAVRPFMPCHPNPFQVLILPKVVKRREALAKGGWDGTGECGIQSDWLPAARSRVTDSGGRWTRHDGFRGPEPQEKVFADDMAGAVGPNGAGVEYVARRSANRITAANIALNTM